MRILFIILDGLGDRPVPQYQGRTTLEAARTPNLDAIAAEGVNGQLSPVAPGIAGGTPTAHASFFGYRLDELPGRAVFHAVARGVDPRLDEVISLGRFASVEAGPQGLRLIERMMTAPEEQSAALAEAIRSYSVDSIDLTLVYTGATESVLRLAGPVSEAITDCDPLGSELPVIKAQPMADAPDPQAAARTAEAVNQYLRWAHAVLDDHPVNRQRVDQGQLPMNFLLAKWAGRRRRLAPFGQRWGFRAASITSEEILLGVMHELGVETMGEEREDIEQDLVERLRTAQDLFRQGYDFVHVHTRQPDAIAHMADPPQKVEAIEALDRGFRYLRQEILPDDDLVVVVTSDHATPSVVSGPLKPGRFHDQHAGEPVPLVILGRNALRDDVRAFSERAAAQGGLGLVLGRDLMPMLLSQAERTNVIGWRPTPHDMLYRPTEVEPFEL
ncbi:MAG: alkaline phosphatase family protein [Dehalococcoidia bacterium]